MARHRIVILGGGFAGVYAAMKLEALAKGRDDLEIVLINHENYLVFQPLLPEVISGDIGLTDTISPLRRLLPRTELFIRDVELVDFEKRQVRLRPGFWPQARIVEYDHLVVALGTVTDFRGSPGLSEHALRFKTLQDAVMLRNHLIQVVQEAGIEENLERKKALLTFVVAGGGFSGVECCAQTNDFVRRMARRERSIDPSLIHVYLAHSGERLLDKEFPPSLSEYAQKVLQKRGVELLLKTRLAAASPDTAVFSDGRRIVTKTLVSTVPSSPNPIVDAMPLPKDKGRIIVDGTLRVQGYDNIWSLGDCALIPLPKGGFAPPTAQHATREAAVLARNIAATIDGKGLSVFAFDGLGKMGALGHRSAVAELFGKIRLSGIPAWLLWRAIYWSKLPGIDRKLRLGLAWFLDLIIPSDFVQLRLDERAGVRQSHYEKDEFVFRQGDLGDALFVILKGSVAILVEADGEQRQITTLKAGEYLGELALMGDTARTASVQCLEPTDLLVINRGDFSALVSHLPDLRKSFEAVAAERKGENRSEQDVPVVST
jgi:NADH:ubiquinone reductase (H+-translocating)